MVTVCLLRAGNQLIGFTASGHAETAPHGEDVVCGAISALTQTALLGLHEVLRLPMEYSVDEAKGIHCVLAPNCTKAQLRDAQIVLDTMAIGLRAIRDAHKGSIDIIEREVAACFK